MYNSSHQSRVLSAIQSVEIEILGLVALKNALEADLAFPFNRLIEQIMSLKGRVIVTGMGKSGHIGRKIVATLASTGTPAYFVHPAEASHGDLGMITPDDLILALSWSGETKELYDILTYAKRFKVTLCAMTSEKKSALAKSSDIVLLLPKAEEACPNNVAPTTSTLMQLALGDAIAVTLLKERGFTSEDFKIYHPGGKLGASLKYVKDVMHKGDSLPLLKQGTLMQEGVILMSSKGFGCIGVVNEQGNLLGMVTDGDLRRHMSPDLLSKPIEVIMTKAPLTASPHMLVSETLEKINTRRITALFVVENEKPIGILHFHDLLRAGVV